MINKVVVSVMFSVFVSSCASIFNQKSTSSTIHTSKPSKIVFLNDTIYTRKNCARITYERSKSPIEVVSIADSTEKRYTIRSINSLGYWANIVYNGGIGLWVEKNNLKRYAYPQNIYLNTNDTLSRYTKYDPFSKKGQMLIHLSLPYVNSFRLIPEHQNTKVNTGFWGISMGLDYYHSKHQYLNISVSGVTDFFLPFPAAVDFYGDYEISSSVYVSLSNNHKVKRFSYGYGLSYAKNNWEYYYNNVNLSSPISMDPVRKKYDAFGFILSSCYEVIPHCLVGVIYRPTFLRPDIKPVFKYEHLISIDLAWKIRIK